jgi:phosphate transport system substrate-binding protein
MNSKPQKRTNYALAKGLLLIALAVIGPIGCTKTETAADPRNLTPMVSIEGSDTMKPLLDDWSKQFMVEHPDIPVSVTIVDSGAGVKALVEKSTDIAASSRDLTNEENETFHTKGIHLVRRIVGLDSIAIIVNPSLPLSEISMSDLRKVFTGDLTKWSELAPTLSGPITVCVREADSGTAQYFNDHVMQPTPSQENTTPGFAKTAKVITSNDSLLETVASEKGAIGFIPLSNAADHLKTVKMLKVKLLDKSRAVMPSADATQDDYSLSRPLYMFFDSRSKPSTRKFVDFCTSDKGQEIVNGHGFVSLKK